MLHLIVLSGLCNRLFAIISGMRYCRNTQQQMTIYWHVPVARLGIPYKGNQIYKMEHLNCFFQPMSDVTLKTWIPNLVPKLQNTGAELILDGSKIIPVFMPKDQNGKPIFPSKFLEMMREPLRIKRKQNIIVNMPTTPFGFSEDPMEDYRRYPSVVGQPRTKTQYELELSKFARKLKLIPTIQNLLNFQYRTIFYPFEKQKIGIHIRRTDLKTSVTYEQLDRVIKEIIQRFHPKQYDIFICSDDYGLQQKYVKQYNLKSYADPSKVNNNIQGIQKALIDLYLLACCDHIFGTKSSSFGYYAWMLARDSTIFEIHS